MDQLQHDPRTKQHLKDALYDFLYTPVQNQFKTRLETIIIRNAILSGYGHKSFTYKGERYSCDVAPPPRAWNRLLPQLRPLMDEYLADLKHLNQYEVPFVVGYINKVLNASNDLGDYLRLLPDCTHRPIEKMIATCPCKATQLEEDKVISIREQNAVSIDLIKQRMVTNLLI
jgi:hypothetical protein